MAQYYADIQGNRGQATRMGTKNSGMTGHVRGWNVGCRVQIDHVDGKDLVRVYKTHGSSGSGSDVLIAAFDKLEEEE